MKNRILAIVCMLCVTTAAGQEVPQDSAVMRLMGIAEHLNSFGNMVPQEKVYLHLDNTSYYHGDNIWFAAYVVSAFDNRPEVLSRTLYVELLDPGGVVVERRVLPIDKGRCHGDFSLTQLPFRSGYYEVRAYTKYMLNFDSRGIFSRVIPVFDSPAEEGDYADRRLARYDDLKYEMKRPRTPRERNVSIRFYPEGGHLVTGLPSRVAFEATDGAGQPLDVAGGRIVGADGMTRAEFSTLHDGRGVFDYTPAAGDEAEITVDGRARRFPLPEAEATGVVMRVDNLSSADSVRFSIRKSAATAPLTLGAVVMCGGRLRNFTILDIEDDGVLSFAVARNKLAAGVARIVLCDDRGNILADRLFFARRGPVAEIAAKTDKEHYDPYTKVTLSIEGRDAGGAALSAPVSVAVRDGDEEIEGGGSVMTELLLRSEIRGYVRRPWYYFEADDATHREALDHLLMVQGWSRYDWDVWSGREAIDLKYMPEQGIEVNGRVIHFSTKKPLTDIKLSVLLRKRGEEELPDSLRSPVPIGFVDVDSLGRFSFGGNLKGQWSMTFSVTNDRNRRKFSRILLDRAFSPEPRAYSAAEMQVTPRVAAAGDAAAADFTPKPIADTLLWREAADTTGDMTERVHRIEEVVVRGDDLSEEARIFRDRSTAVRYYDMPSEVDALRDEGDLTRDLYEVLSYMDDNFIIRRASMAYGRERDTASRSAATGIESSLRERAGVQQEDARTEEMETYGEWNISYKGKDVLFVVDHKPSWETLLKADLIRLAAIKSIYVNEDASVICDYADRQMSPMDALSRYSCVVFVETYPENEIPTEAGRGIRKTWVDGYDEPAEFYLPDYSVMPSERDYRRTLYWNPSLMLDADGRAGVTFYNNGRCRTMRIDIETVTDGGAVGAFER